MPNYIFGKAGGAYDLPPSLAANKSLLASKKLAEKTEYLNPSPVPLGPTPEELAAANARIAKLTDSGSGLIDMAESSIYQGVGNVADSYANIQQNMLGNEDYALSEGVDNLSNEAYADEKAGFTGRGAYQKDIQSLTESVAKEDKSLMDYAGIIGQGISLGPRALADSAASGLELAAGAAATGAVTAVAGPIAGLATGGALLASKANRAKKVVDKVVSFSDRIKHGVKAVPSVVAKTAGRTSLLTADITEQMRQEYIEANNGKEPSGAWYATNVPVTMALNAIELGIITRALPKLPKPIIADMKEATKIMSKSHAKAAAGRIFNGAKKVFASAGAEAGQEYLQTWHEILAPVVDGESMETILRDSATQWGIPKNQTESAVGSILGFTAGGTARLAPVAVTTGAGVALDATKATAKGVATVSKAAALKVNDVRNTAASKILNDDERAFIAGKDETRKAVAAEKVAEIDTQLKAVDEAKTYEELLDKLDEETSETAIEIQKKMHALDGDMKDPAKLSEMKDRLSRGMKAVQTKINLEVKASNLADVATKSASNIKDAAIAAAVKAVNAIPEDVARKAVAAKLATIEAAEGAIQAAKDLRSSTAVGVVEMGMKGTAKHSKLAYDAAKDLSLNDMDNAVRALAESNPNLSKKIDKLYQDKKAQFERLGLSNEHLVNNETLNPVVADVAEKNTLEGQSAAAVAEAIEDTLAGVIADKDTLAKVQKALAAYKASPAFTEGQKGAMSKANMTELERRVENAERRLSRNVEDVTDAVVTKVAKGAEVVTGAVASGIDATRKFTQTLKLKKAAKKGPEALRVAQAEVDKDNADRKAGKDAKEKAAKEAETTVKKQSTGSKVSEAVDTVVETTKEAVQDITRKRKTMDKTAPGYAAIQEVTNALEGGLVEDIKELAEGFANMMATPENGSYTTTQDFNDLVAQFPGLAVNPEFYAMFRAQFATDVVIQEDTTTENTPIEQLATEEKVAPKKRFVRCK